MTPTVSRIRRLPLEVAQGRLDPDANVALEIQLADDTRDLFILLDVEDPLGRSQRAEDEPILQKEWGVSLQGEMCLIRKSHAGVQKVIVGKGKALQVDGLIWQWPGAPEAAEEGFYP